MLSKKPVPIMMNYQLRTQHYLPFLRVPFEIHERHIVDNTVLGVLEFPPKPKRPFYTYVTSGMSELPQTSPDGADTFTEILFYNDKSASWCIDMLVKMANYPFEHATFFASNQTLPLAGSIIPGSPLTAIVFLEPIFEPSSFHWIEEIPGKRIEIIWALPITERERQFIIEQSVDEFIKRAIDRDNLSMLLNLKRQSLI